MPDTEMRTFKKSKFQFPCADSVPAASARTLAHPHFYEGSSKSSEANAATAHTSALAEVLEMADDRRSDNNWPFTAK